MALFRGYRTADGRRQQPPDNHGAPWLSAGQSNGVIPRISDAPVRVVDGPTCKGACHSFIFLFFLLFLANAIILFSSPWTRI
ncbi:hypothetical protein M433DRAFT_161209, partial [Acidomyces richmondensis BFW]